MPPPKRPPSIMGDDERAAHGRTQRAAIPDEIDPEMTPPPQAPPELDALEMPDQIRVLAATVARHAEGLERVWSSRHDAGRITQLQTSVVGIQRELAQSTAALSEFLKPAVKHMMARVDAIEKGVQAFSTRFDTFLATEWPRVIQTLEDHNGRIARLEHDVSRLGVASDTSNARAADMGGLTLKKFDEFKAMDEKQEVRIRVLEDFRLSLKVQVAVVSTVISIVFAAIGLAMHFLLK